MAIKREDMEPPAPPDPWAVLQGLTKALEGLQTQIAAGQGTDRTESLLETLSGALVRLGETQLEGSKLIADETRRAARPSNQVVPNRSVFNRRGETLPEDAEGPRKQRLKCLMMIPWLAEFESLTREEVDLLNLLEPGEYQVKRIDNSKVRVDVQIDYKIDNITPSRLLMTHDTAFNNDYFRLMPPLTEWLRQMLRQHEPLVAAQARAVLTDEEEEALIEAGQLTVSV